MHQDWDVVTLRAKVAERPPSAYQHQSATQSTTSSKPAWKIEKQVDDETSKKAIEYTSREDAKSIVDRRMALRLSQRDLAMRVNVDVKEIQAIESCRAVENRNLLAKIRRVLHDGMKKMGQTVGL